MWAAENSKLFDTIHTLAVEEGSHERVAPKNAKKGAQNTQIGNHGGRESLGGPNPLAGQFAEEFPLVHPIFEGFTAVYENNGDLISELASQRVVGVDVDFTPTEAAPALELRQLLFDNFTKVASFAGVHNDLSRIEAGLRAHRGVTGV